MVSEKRSVLHHFGEMKAVNILTQNISLALLGYLFATATLWNCWSRMTLQNLIMF